MTIKESTPSVDGESMQRAKELLADLNRMGDELEVRNEQTRQRIARTDELLTQWSREQAVSDMGAKA